jgi:hypothetical protein
VLCGAATYAKRGVFKNEKLVRVVLGRRSRWLAFLVEHHDLVVRPDGSYYVEGWEEWQEGNWQVAERMARVRSRRHGDALRDGEGDAPDRNGDRNSTSDARRLDNDNDNDVDSSSSRTLDPRTPVKEVEEAKPGKRANGSATTPRSAGPNGKRPPEDEELLAERLAKYRDPATSQQQRQTLHFWLFNTMGYDPDAA